MQLTKFNEVIHFFDKRKQIGIKPGLERVYALLECVNHPEKKLRAVHVAGTNGKGSTIYLLQNALIANGYRVGTFVSPSFTGLRGHFLINSKEIARTKIIELLNILLPHIRKLDEKYMHPTEYEILTAMAFLYFAREKIDIALIETGMGGRFDTTNCFIPVLSIITSIAIDHTQFLGKTHQEIAYHKAGIIKNDTPVIVGRVAEEARVIIEEEAKKQSAPYYQLGNDFFVTQIDENVARWTDGVTSFSFFLKLLGKHYFHNASLVIMALVLLGRNQVKINWEKVFLAIRETIIPGRFEQVYDKPVIVLDGAHNTASVDAFMRTVDLMSRKEERHLLFAVFKDKAFSEMISQLQTHFSSMTLTTFTHERAASEQELSSIIEKNNLTFTANWQQYVTDIIHSNEDHVYFITGSLHFISLVRTFLKHN